MKRFLLALFASFALAAPAFAIVGGPWDANIPGNPISVNPADINGTYQGTIKGKNLAGVLIFSTSETGSGYTQPSTSYEIFTTGTISYIIQTYSRGSYPGLATVFIEGGVGLAGVEVSAQLGARKLAGVMDGATTRAATFTISATGTNGSTTFWNVVDNVSFTGAFSAKLSNWASNSFSGKGTLAVRKFDLDAFNTDVATDPDGVAAFPQAYIRTVFTPIKVSGAKTSDEATTYEATLPSSAEPTVTFEGFK